MPTYCLEPGKPIAFEVFAYNSNRSPRYVKIESTTSDGKSWAIRDEGGLCFTKLKEWIAEPLPSSRDESYFTETRFLTACEAFEFASKNIERK